MLSEKVQNALNAQLNMELTAWYTYLSMAAHFEHEAFPGFARWMRHHSEEEMMHAMKICDHLHDRRGRVSLTAVPTPPGAWATPLAAFEDALKHEQKVTASINALVELASAERDYATVSFLQWYVDEQVEEEKIVDDAIQKLKRIGDFGAGLYLLDRELAEGGGEEAEEGEAEETGED